jgi:hypothetical protein
METLFSFPSYYIFLKKGNMANTSAFRKYE